MGRVTEAEYGLGHLDDAIVRLGYVRATGARLRAWGAVYEELLEARCRLEKACDLIHE